MDVAKPLQSTSLEAPLPAPSTTPIKLSLINEERANLATEVERLEVHLVIGKVVGSLPSHDKLCDQLLGFLLVEVEKIVDVQPLGKGFYQVEFKAVESVSEVIQLLPPALHGTHRLTS